MIDRYTLQLRVLTVIPIAIFIFFLSFYGCTSNTLPQTTIEMDAASMEEVCRGNGYLVEKLEEDGKTIISCVFRDGSSCDAREFYQGSCFPVNKEFTREIIIDITAPLEDLSSFSLVIGYDNNKIIPMLREGGNNLFYGSSNQIRFEEMINVPDNTIIGASANRKTILFALNTNIPIVLSGNVAKIYIQSVSVLTADDISIDSAIISKSDGSQINVERYVSLHIK
jgi:putative hemolysin